MTNTQKFQENELIVIVPHYINSLRYYDKMYEHLIKENINVLYFFTPNTEMEDFCVNNHRAFETFSFKRNNIILSQFQEPYMRYKFKKRIMDLFQKYSPKLILQMNDALPYNDLIVKAAKELNISTMILQWAITYPEKYYFFNNRIKLHKELQTKSLLSKIIIKFIQTTLNIFNYPLIHILNVNSNYKQSYAQGDSDIVGVINDFTRTFLIKQGVRERKVKVLGSLHFDNALDCIKYKNVNKIKERLNIKPNEIILVFFSQPFYRKDITLITLSEQIEYISNLINTIDTFYKNLGKKYYLILKLHPIENIDDYKHFTENKKIKILKEADNYELILISDLCISQHSTVLQSAIVMKKHVLSLNILNFDVTEMASKIIGIKQTVNSWDDFVKQLKNLDENKEIYEKNINYDKVILDGNSYNRIIDQIKNLMYLTKRKLKE